MDASAHLYFPRCTYNVSVDIYHVVTNGLVQVYDNAATKDVNRVPQGEQKKKNSPSRLAKRLFNQKQSTLPVIMVAARVSCKASKCFRPALPFGPGIVAV